MRSSQTSTWRNWLQRMFWHTANEDRTLARKRRIRQRAFRPSLERLEERTVPTVLNSSFQGLANQGYAPDSQGAVGPQSYVETVNQTIAIYSKSTGQLLPGTAGPNSDFLDDFFTTQGKLAPVSLPPPPAPPGSPPPPNPVHFSDPVVIYDNLVGRFIVGDQNISDPGITGGTGAAVFDIAISNNSNPQSLTNADWKFYQIDTTEKDPKYNGSNLPNFFTDYPGNLGYNADALVFTLNEISSDGSASHSLITTVSMSNLVKGTLQYQQADAGNDPQNNSIFSLRPTAMQDDTGKTTGDPMWMLVVDTSTNAQGQHYKIDVYSMPVVDNTGALTKPNLGAATTLSVNPFNAPQPLQQPNGKAIAGGPDGQVDFRILQAAEANNVLVATQTVGNTTNSMEDDARWYELNVSPGMPALLDQGDVNTNAGPPYATYAAYPGITINSRGDIGMSFLETGTVPGQYISMYVTGRTPSDPKGTMETPVLVQAGLQTYSDTVGMRAGDLSGINVDADGSFWAVNEYANTISSSSGNWGTTISHFTVGQAADLSVVDVGPSTVTAGGTAAYMITVTNNGPSDIDSVTLTDTLSSGLILMSADADPNNTDSFNKTIAGNTATFTLPTGSIIKAGTSDVFKVVVKIPSTFAASSYITNTAAITSSSTTVPDPNLFNNTATAQSTVTTSADVQIVSVSGPSTITAGTDVAYTVTIVNNGPSDAQNVTVPDLLPTGLAFQATPAAQFSGPDTFTLQGNNLVATIVTAGNTDVLQFFAHAPSNLLPNGNLLTDTASVTTTTTDPTIPDNAQVSSTLITSANLAVTVSPPPPVVEGDKITYNVTVTNNGPSDAQNVVLFDVLSTDMTLVSANFGAAPVSSSGNTISVALGALTAGNTVTGTIIVQTTEDGDLTNSASVSSSTSDPTPLNNSVTVTTSVSEDAINLMGGVSFTTVEFAALNNVMLATFTHAQTVEPPSAFTALVSWGDGSVSPVNVVLSGGTYAVAGSHTYNAEGAYSILVTISEDGASASATDGASIHEAPLPPGLPQSIAASPDFETIEDGLSQPLSMGQAVSIERSLPSLLFQTVQDLMQQGQAPFLALPDIMAATIVERIDDLFHQPLSPAQLQSVQIGLLNLYIQTALSLMQQGQDPGQALVSSFYLNIEEYNLFTTVLMNNGVSLDTAVSQMLPSLLLQVSDIIDASTDL
jgi:uncharacterized repeat protein (TIGR01451 family)